MADLQDQDGEESSSPALKLLLSNLESEGQSSGRGSFGLDPTRAIELLREQGALGKNAPLFLLRAIYLHTGGATIKWKKILFGYNLQWDEAMGAVPNDTNRLLAEGAFKAFRIKLQFEPGHVHIHNADHLSAPFSVRFDETFGQARERLVHYPVEGLFPKRAIAEPFHAKTFPEGRLEYFQGVSHVPALDWIVCGISFKERTALPLKVVIFDDQLVCDLSLSTLPVSERKRLWEERAHQEFQALLSETIHGVEEILLDLEPLSKSVQSFLGYLPYVVSLQEESTLRGEALRRVKFKDVFGQHWSLATLLEIQARDQKLLTVPSVPNDCPKKPVGDRPVLLWRDQTKEFGTPLFRETQSGAGYLYSLRRGEVHQQNRSLGRVLANVDWEFGEIGLRPMQTMETRCEVELFGTRRSSETVHLEEPAPRGLRVFWRSNEEVASWTDDVGFLRRFREKVVELVDRAFEDLDVSPEWLLGLLEWADTITSFQEFPNLRKAPFFRRVDGRCSCYEQLAELGAPVPVINDLSASIPTTLPFAVVLWHHPLLERLELATKEVGKAVRQAHWQEQGRQKWLERYPCVPLEESDYLKDRSFQELDGHYLVRLEDTETPSRLVIWREGRPLYDRPIPQVDYPRGFLLVYCDNEFPGDAYWAGPDLNALQEVLLWTKHVQQTALK